jgi:hypothetical protein
MKTRQFLFTLASVSFLLAVLSFAGVASAAPEFAAADRHALAQSEPMRFVYKDI